MLGILALNCNNIGFVEKAKAVANNEFGVEVFALTGSTTGGDVLGTVSTAFTTSCTGITGITKANCICQVQATSQQFVGTYRAWISISGSVDAICNIQGNEGTGCSVNSSMGPFLRKNGSSYTVLAGDYIELSTTGFKVALDSSPGYIWSGTKPDGRASGLDCTGFTSPAPTAQQAGERSKAGLSFTTGETIDCSSASGTFLCMKQTK